MTTYVNPNIITSSKALSHEKKVVYVTDKSLITLNQSKKYHDNLLFPWEIKRMKYSMMHLGNPIRRSYFLIKKNELGNLFCLREIAIEQ